MNEAGSTKTPPTLGAVFWTFVGRHLFRHSPYSAFALRRFLLRLSGAKLSRRAKIRRSVFIDCPWNLTIGGKTAIGDDVTIRAAAPVSIGRRCTVSQLAMICTEARRPGGSAEEVRIRPITLEDDSWVASDVLVLPGVTIGAGAVIGARSLVENDVPSWTLAGGDPLRVFRERVIESP